MVGIDIGIGFQKAVASNPNVMPLFISFCMSFVCQQNPLFFPSNSLTSILLNLVT